MTTYNTGNALGSSDARDLYDNAENIDNFANGAANTYQDRLGVNRKSLAGMNAAFDDFIESSGYTVPVAYTSGIVLTEYNQLIEYNDEFYKLKAGQAPYTTTGTWVTDSAKLVSVGDAALRQELTANANDFNLLPELASYAALDSYTGDLTAVYVRGVANVFDGGHGVFRRTTDTPSAANGIYRQDGAGRWWRREFSGAINPLWFGVSGSDNTAAVLAAHTFANSENLPVTYSGIKEIFIVANAQIPVKTSVDFCYCNIRIVGGVNSPPDNITMNDMFIVSDDDCPLVVVTGAVTASNLVEGSMFPTIGIFNGHGYALVECGLQVPNRSKTGTMNYKQSFKVNRNGRVSYGLSTDISAYADSITVSYRKTSDKRLKISNISFQETGWNNQRIINVQRCNVEIDGVTLMFSGGAYNNIDRIISVINASDIYIKNIITSGRPVTLTEGSYVVNLDGAADVYVDNMNAITGWGAVGSNNINGIRFTNCVLNRIDAHSSGHNMFVESSSLHEYGMVYGWGGGILSVKNCVLNRTFAVSTRSDYGGTLFGDIVVDNCETSNSGSSTVVFVDMQDNPLGASVPVFAPKTVTVTNCRRVGKASGANAELVPVRMQIAGASNVVYAPIAITVDNIVCHAGWRFGLRIDWLNMEANPTSSTLRVAVSNALATAVASTTSGVVEYASIRTPSSKVKPWIIAHDVENLHVICTSDNDAQVEISSCGLNGVKLHGSSPARCVIDSCRLTNPASGYSSPSALAPVGGIRNGNNNFTILRNCEISGSAVWDLSLISAAIGNTIRNASGTPSLPSGATTTTFFTGWRASGAFQ